MAAGSSARSMACAVSITFCLARLVNALSDCLKGCIIASHIGALISVIRAYCLVILSSIKIFGLRFIRNESIHCFVCFSLWPRHASVYVCSWPLVSRDRQLEKWFTIIIYVVVTVRIKTNAPFFWRSGKSLLYRKVRERQQQQNRLNSWRESC